MKIPEDLNVSLDNKEIKDIGSVRSGRALQEMLGVELSRNKIELSNINLEKIPPQIALRIFDSIHSYSSSLKLSGIEVFQHLDFRTHDLVPKTKERNSDLLPKEQRTNINLDVHTLLEKNENDIEKTTLELGKEAVNKAKEITFSGITNEIELAIAGKVAHAAHGLIEELAYQNKDKKEIVKSWKVE